jgi:hypothetical protein
MAAPRVSASALNALLLSLTGGISILPKDIGADEEGTAFDATGAAHVLAWLSVAAASASTDFTITVQESDLEAGSYTDVAAGSINPAQPDVINDDAAGNHNKQVFAVITVDPAKPFLRWDATGVGGTQALIASAGFISGTFAQDLKPYQLEQIVMELKSRFVDYSSGEPPTGQAKLRTILGS